MGNSGSVVLKFQNKTLYRKRDGSHIWTVQNGNNLVKNPVIVNISNGFSYSYDSDIILTHNNKDGFRECKYTGYVRNDKHMFCTSYGTRSISSNEITKYDIKSFGNHNSFNFNVYVIEIPSMI